jgi:hypothetical protein
MHYSPIDYWTPGWVYPRERLREPFPRRVRRFSVSLMASSVSSAGTPERTFAAAPRGQTFDAPARGQTFAAAPRGETFLT